VTPEGLSEIIGLTHLQTISLPWDTLSEQDIQTLASLAQLKEVVLSGRIITRDALSRMQSLARRPHPGGTTDVTLHTPTAMRAPAAKATVLASPVAMHDKKRVSESLSRSVVLPGDVVPMMPSRTPIALDNETRGKGMELEVNAGGPRRRKSLAGLKRIHQAEIVQAIREPDLLPGESRIIKSPKEDASNSLGEIEIGTHR
jgi:hypothetical protein